MNLILINIIILTLLPIIVTSQYAASAIDIDGMYGHGGVVNFF